MAENAPKNNTSKTNTGAAAANATKTNNTSAAGNIAKTNNTGANATKTNNTSATANTGANATKTNSSLNAEINKLLSNTSTNASKTNNTGNLAGNKGNANNNNNNNNNENNLLKENNGSKKNNNKNKSNIEEPSLVSQGADTITNALSSIKESIMGEPEVANSNSNKSNKSASTSNKTNENKTNESKTNESKNRNNEESRKRYENVRVSVEPESSGGSIIMLVVKVVIMVAVLVALYYLGNYLIKRYLTASVSSPYLMNTTKNAKNALVVSQDPNSINYIPILKSEGQDGIQFTYGFWFLIESMDYKKGEWKHVFHKGNSSSYPNRAPGVWFHPDKNSIRVYMNTMDNILEYVDVDNLPIRKWVYMNVILNNRNLDLYVNGYLKIRKELSSLPKQNDDDFWVSMYGGFEGYLSNIRYYAYAIDFNEIYSNINAGPSTNNCIDTGEVPPYLDDKWWFDYNG